MDISIRLSRAEDLAAINAIYNHYVMHSTCTYQEEPETEEGRRKWFAAHGEKHPVTVAVDEAGEVVGWGSLNQFHGRCAYRFTVENSVYVRHDSHRKGIGRALLRDLMERAKGLGHHVILAVISADQTASVALHAREGFVEAGRLREVGFKYGRWLDVVYMQWDVGSR
ncbi:MAG TPA: GNAT family N-acetyltransferase [Phycisphaerae bacterium]|nr:GNAT family N-acetyltransferase [Phycisphaerae bacterium]